MLRDRQVMRVLLEAHHPAHVHFFKHPVRTWLDRGDSVLMIGRDRDVIKRLLTAYSFIPSEVATTAGRNNRFPVVEMLGRQLRVARRVSSFRPDVVLSLMGSYTQSARLLGVPNVIFTDSEFQSFNHKIAHPFATRIYTPECFWKALGPKQRRYRGYHELAFLHPKRFRPEPAVLESLGVRAGQFVVLRTSAWNTFHDIGERGFATHLDTFLERITSQIDVLIVPEGGQLPARWASRQLRAPAERFHDVIAFAQLVVTEGASTASEAACLGVPAVFLNSTERGYLNDQERRYGLVHNFKEPDQAIARVLELLANPPAEQWRRKQQQRLIEDHIDVADYVVNEIDAMLDETSHSKNAVRASERRS